MVKADTETSAHGASDLPGHPGRAGLVAAELVRVQYRNIPTAVTVNAVISALLCLALWDTVAPERLTGWLAAISLVAVVRYLFWRRFTEQAAAPTDTLFWQRAALLGCCVNG